MQQACCFKYAWGLKAGAVLVDLRAAYDTVWNEGLTYKFLKVTSYKTITYLLNNMLSNRVLQISMCLSLSESKLLSNGLPQGLVLAPLLTYWLPHPKKFIYANDTAIATQHTNINKKLAENFREWRWTVMIILHMMTINFVDFLFWNNP